MTETEAETRPPFLRSRRAGVAGVARGLADHLGLRPALVRLAFALGSVMGGAGVVAYVFWWVTVPLAPPGGVSTPTPAAWSRLARPLRGDGSRRGLRVGDVVVGLGLLAVAALLLASRLGDGVQQTWVIPSLLLLVGIVLAWSELDARRSGHSRSRVRVARLFGGLAIAVVAIVLLVGQGAQPVVVVQSALAAVAVLCGVALMLAPWWLRLVRELGDARAERERESERADIAAHLHDSVLQTLALIKARSHEPEVVRLARAQERDLRAWLYEDRTPAELSVAAQLGEIVALVEDTRLHPDGTAPDIETVVVGDMDPGALGNGGAAAVLAATREALLNAVAHGAPPVSVYLEAHEASLEVFVRDHGPGFDPEHVPTDRFGVRESILGRLRRRGGEADIVTLADGGTEVRLYLARQEPAGDKETP